MTEPHWPERPLPEDRLPDIYYYSAPKKKNQGAEVARRGRSGEILETYEKLGIPLREQKRLEGVAVDAVFDSVSVARPSRRSWPSTASSSARSARRCASTPSWCEVPRLGRARYSDNFFAALNSAVFSDGSFVYIPKGVRCPMELSTYFRINARTPASSSAR
jgi:Fe-S cluster assembly protein SufB